MNEENSNGLYDLIKRVKSQPPLLPIDGIAGMSKGFFSSTSSWFQGLVKPVLGAVTAIVLLVSGWLIMDNRGKGEAEKETHSVVIVNKDSITLGQNSIPPSYDTLEESTSFNTASYGVDPDKNVAIMYRNRVKNDVIVEISNGTYKLKSEDSSVLITLSADKQTFKVNPFRDTMIVGKMGTKVVFYQACFEDSTGQTATSEVSIILKECYNYPDMVKENLNTHWDSGYLESKGMIWLAAASEGKELKLREGFDCPIEFSSPNVDDYGLYYADANKYQTTNWTLDSLGKIPNPVVIPFSGRYWDITFNFFMDNYKLKKETMLGLYQKRWGAHFTSAGTKMIGFRACESNDYYLDMACVKFRELCEDIYTEVPEIRHSSRETYFGFACVSRDSLNKFLANDTIQNKVQKAVFGINMNTPFFASRMGWINCDHPVYSVFKRSENNTIALKDCPTDGFTQFYLMLKKRKVIVNAMKTDDGYTFIGLPKNAEAILFSYKLVNGKISFVRKDINTSDGSISLGGYGALENSDALIAKMNELIDPTVN